MSSVYYPDERLAEVNPFDVRIPEAEPQIPSLNLFKPAPGFFQRARKWITGDTTQAPPQDYEAVRSKIEAAIAHITPPSPPISIPAPPKPISTSWASLLVRLVSEKLWPWKTQQPIAAASATTEEFEDIPLKECAKACAEAGSSADAAHLYQLAAAKGDAESTLELALAYISGDGVDEDITKAQELLETLFIKHMGTKQAEQALGYLKILTRENVSPSIPSNDSGPSTPRGESPMSPPDAEYWLQSE